MSRPDSQPGRDEPARDPPVGHPPVSEPGRGPLQLPLRLRPLPGPAPEGEVRAALLPGGDAATWLELLAGWGRPVGGLALWPLPPREGEAAPAGALLTLPRARGPAAGGVAETVGARESAVPAGALPLRLAGGCLYVPLDCRLDPDLSDEELVALVGAEAALLHPAHGLVHLPRAAALGVTDLLSPPPLLPASWGPPVQAAPLLPPLTRVDPPAATSLDGLLAEAREGLRSPPPASPQRPRGGGAGAGAGAAGAGRPAQQDPNDPQPEGQGSGEAGAGARAREGGAGTDAGGGASGPDGAAGGGAAGGAGGGGAGGGGTGGVGEGWLRRALRTVEGWFRGGEGDEAQPGEPEQAPEPEPEFTQPTNERELDRLLRMLEEDPDRALRHALPLAGSPSTQAPAEERPAPRRLVERDPRFTVDPPQRARAAPWVVTADLHLRLARRYRELAERELALGRPLRAAYVYWQLLGDARAAAQALEQGGHHREAAEMWQRRLRQPHEAARCLERGGLLLEAAELWAGEGELERAGDLYQRLGREQEARAHWKAATEALRVSGDPCGAARLLEQKLDAPAAALEILHAGWPGGAQARECLRHELLLLGRLGRHEDTGRRLQELLREGPPRWREQALAEVLLDCARRYPDAALRERCGDGVRVVAGLALPRASSREAETLVRMVSAVDPQDRLLGRDARRYLATIRRRAAALEVRNTPLREARRVREIALPRGVTWEVACGAGDGFWAAGRGPTGPMVLRGRWEGGHQQVSWPGLELRGELLLLPPAGPGAPALVATRGGGRLPLRVLPAHDALGAAVKVATPGWVPEGLRAWHLVQGVGVVWLLHGNAHGLVLSAHYPDAAGRVLQTDLIADGAAVQALETAPAHVLRLPRGPVWVALGARLEQREGRRLLASVDTEQPVVGLSGAAGRPYLAASLEQGLLLLRVRHPGRLVDEVPLARELQRPQVVFTGDGRLVAAGAHEGRVYDVGGPQPLLRATFPGPGAGVIAALPCPSPRQVAFVTRGGWVRVYELP